MISYSRTAEVSPLDDIALVLKVPPFHTDSLTYSHRERGVYHDRRDCVYGQRIKQDGNVLRGTGQLPLCNRCTDLGAGVDDAFPGDEGG